MKFLLHFLSWDVTSVNPMIPQLSIKVVPEYQIMSDFHFMSGMEDGKCEVTCIRSTSAR